MRHRTGIVLLVAGLLPGCYREPPTGEIMVDTRTPRASCVISQLGKPLGIAKPTPAIALVTLGNEEIGVTCRRPGFAEAAVTIPPPLPGAAMPGFVANRRPEIDYRTRIDITMTPAPPGVP